VGRLELNDRHAKSRPLNLETLNLSAQSSHHQSSPLILFIELILQRYPLQSLCQSYNESPSETAILEVRLFMTEGLRSHMARASEDEDNGWQTPKGRKNGPEASTHRNSTFFGGLASPVSLKKQKPVTKQKAEPIPFKARKKRMVRIIGDRSI
jgi:hypothetical protein